MRRSKIVVYFHLVWATKNRQPILTPELERDVYRCFVSKAEEMECAVVAMGGMPDHVHLLLRFPATISLSDAVKRLKGVSSALVNDKQAHQSHFRWQEGYACFSVSRSHVKAVTDYVVNQKTHHANNDLHAEWEETDTAYQPADP